MAGARRDEIRMEPALSLQAGMTKSRCRGRAKRKKLRRLAGSIHYHEDAIMSASRLIRSEMLSKERLRITLTRLSRSLTERRYTR